MDPTWLGLIVVEDVFLMLSGPLIPINVLNTTVYLCSSPWPQSSNGHFQLKLDSRT